MKFRKTESIKTYYSAQEKGYGALYEIRISEFAGETEFSIDRICDGIEGNIILTEDALKALIDLYYEVRPEQKVKTQTLTTCEHNWHHTPSYPTITCGICGRVEGINIVPQCRIRGHDWQNRLELESETAKDVLSREIIIQVCKRCGERRGG